MQQLPFLNNLNLTLVRIESPRFRVVLAGSWVGIGSADLFDGDLWPWLRLLLGLSRVLRALTRIIWLSRLEDDRDFSLLGVVRWDVDLWLGFSWQWSNVFAGLTAGLPALEVVGVAEAASPPEGGTLTSVVVVPVPSHRLIATQRSLDLRQIASS